MMRTIKFIIVVISMCLTLSCGNRELSYDEVEYDEATQTVLYEGKPFTGKVNGDVSHANEQAIVRNGKIVDVIETTEKANGYKKVRHQDKSCEYYDYDGNRISKTEYEKND